MPRQRANKSAIRALAELNGTNYTTALRAFEADERALAALILDNMPSDPETAGPRTPDPGASITVARRHFHGLTVAAGSPNSRIRDAPRSDSDHVVYARDGRRNAASWRTRPVSFRSGCLCGVRT